MIDDEFSVYEITGGDYSIYRLGFSEARDVANEIMRLDPYGGIPFVLKLPTDAREAPEGSIRISMSDFELFLEKVSDPYPTPEDE